MNMLDKPKIYFMFSASFLIPVVSANQIGVGILRFQKDLFDKVHHDAWISVVIAGLITHLAVWLIIRTLQQYESIDLYGVHYDVYGKWLGSALSVVYVLFMLIISLIILTAYIEVVQVWMFPELPVWIVSAIILLLVNYGIGGGIRTVVGFCVLSFMFGIWMLFVLFYDLRYTDAENFLPIAEAEISSLFQGAKAMVFTLIGFEIIYFVYPFIKQKNQAQRNAHLGVLLTTFIYLFVIAISTIYFSEGQVLKSNWPTLSLFKIVQLPFLERLEYVIVAMWLLVILPNLLLYMWAASRGMKRMFHWKQKYAVYLFSVILFMGSISLDTDRQLKMVGVFADHLSFYIGFIYPFLLYGMVKIRVKFRKRRGA